MYAYVISVCIYMCCSSIVELYRSLLNFLQVNLFYPNLTQPTVLSILISNYRIFYLSMYVCMYLSICLDISISRSILMLS